MTCGTLNIKEAFIIITTILFLGSCDSTSSNECDIMYIIKSENDTLAYYKDTIRVFTLKNGKYMIVNKDTNYFHFSGNQVFLSNDLNSSNIITHDLSDTTIIISNPLSNSFFPLYARDTRYIENKEYLLNGIKYKIYKFREDVSICSNCIKYSYFLEGFGFILYDNYYENEYLDIEKLSSKFELNLHDLKELTAYLKSDSLFFEKSKKINPPKLRNLLK